MGDDHITKTLSPGSGSQRFAAKWDREWATSSSYIDSDSAAIQAG